MNQFHLPFVKLPSEYVTLLKTQLSETTAPDPVFEILRPNKSLYSLLEKAFTEFNDGRGLPKVMTALGWLNFRERFASIYIYRNIFGKFPTKTSMELVEEIKYLEARYSPHSVHGNSRLFLLGFYLKLAKISIQKREDNRFLDLKLPEAIAGFLRLSQVRTERIDWLILILWNFHEFLGEKLLLSSLANGKKFSDIQSLLSADDREQMHTNLLAYAASIDEQDVFLFDKI